MTRFNPRLVIGLVLAATLLLTPDLHAGKGKKKQAAAETVVTEHELQGDLMSYADRYASLVAQAIDDVDRLQPSPEVRGTIHGDLVFAAAAAFTIAADANPQLALLDTLVLSTLGRMVFEEYWSPRYGAVADPVIVALTTLEKDIWAIAAGILTAEQQEELHERIALFRQEHPEVTTFSHLRFADFPSKRATSTLKASGGGGIFKSVGRITEQVEQTRMLAERGIYLSTRLPLLSGGFADIWLTRLSFNPASQQVLGEVHTFADVAERMAVVAEELPVRIAEERSNAIEQVTRDVDVLRAEALDQVFEGIAEERQQIIEQLVAEEERVTGVLQELRLTLAAGNDLTLSATTLAETLDLGPSEEEVAPPEPAEPAKPFDIEEYRQTVIEAGATVRELDTLVGSAQELLDSAGTEGLVAALQEASDTGTAILDRVFLQAALLIILVFVGFVAARLTYRWLAVRLVGSVK